MRRQAALTIALGGLLAAREPHPCGLILKTSLIALQSSAGTKDFTMTGNVGDEVDDANRWQENKKQVLMLVGSVMLFSSFLAQFMSDGMYCYRIQFPGRLLVMCASSVIVFVIGWFSKQSLGSRLAYSALRLAVIGIFVFLNIYVTAAYQIDAVPDTLCAFVQVLNGVKSALLLFPWNVHFALYDTENAGRTLPASMLLSLLLTLLILYTSPTILYLSHAILPFIAAYICIIIDYSDVFDQTNTKAEVNDQRLLPAEVEPLKAVYKTRVLFFGVRILWGLAFGAAFAIARTSQLVEIHAFARLALTLSFLVLSVMLTILGRHSGGDSLWKLTLTPLLLMGVFVLLPFDTSSAVAIVPMWLAWHYQSYLQLPTYTCLCRMRAERFAYLEMAAQNIPYALIGIALSYGFDASAFDGLGSVPAVVAYAAVAVSSFVTMRHVAKYYPRPEPSWSMAQVVIEQRMDRIAQDSGLTQRELEVLKIAGRGYSRPYIEKALYISQGTAKTHLRHIYQKLGVSSQDELLQMVGGCALAAQEHSATSLSSAALYQPAEMCKEHQHGI